MWSEIGPSDNPRRYVPLLSCVEVDINNRTMTAEIPILQPNFDCYFTTTKGGQCYGYRVFDLKRVRFLPSILDNG